METKTIGKLIAALRKANGMTQKELAEKLNVSDKTVSRWERDDGAPDLSVIPVIAEIFDVTCDELLRGERKPAAEREPEQPAETSAKGKKQKQRILTMSLYKCRTQTFISIGISALGLIAAMICNFGFNRAYIGFFAALVFYAASLVCQAVFVNGAFLSVSDDDLTDAEVGMFKTSIIQMARRCVSITASFFAATMPLIIYPEDAYCGLVAGSWLPLAVPFVAACVIVCSIAWFFLYPSLLKNGVCSLNEQEENRFWHNFNVKKKVATLLSLIMLTSFLFQCFVNYRWDAYDLAEETEFYDYDSFVAYMEQPSSSYSFDGVSTEQEYIPEWEDDITYYDEYGNEVSEEEALREELIISDGSPEGKVVRTYIRRNDRVCGWSVSDSKDGLPIKVVTDTALEAANSKLSLINLGFFVLYLLEWLCLYPYLLKRCGYCLSKQETARDRNHHKLIKPFLFLLTAVILTVITLQILANYFQLYFTPIIPLGIYLLVFVGYVLVANKKHGK